jgi:spermidine/putrescine transport system ATP-binding protein
VDGALLELRSIRKSYARDVQAVAGIDLQVRQGEFLTLLGPSGSGKTTTLRIVAGFEHPDSGEVWLEGARIDPLPANRRPVNTVFQDYALFPHLNVRENIGFGLRAERLPRAEIASRVSAALEQVDLAGFDSRRPGQLSGGQRQRVALARALVMRPRVLLLDEPLGALDLKLRKRMQLVLMDLCRELGITFMYVTHDQEEALTMSDRIAVMADGLIQQCASPQTLYDEPATTFVADFVGETNLLRGRLAGRDGERAEVDIHGHRLHGTAVGEPGADVVVAVRPEAIQLHPAGTPASLPARVTRVLFVAGEARLFALLESGDEVQLRLPPEAATGYAPEQDLNLGWRPEAGRVFGT